MTTFTLTYKESQRKELVLDLLSQRETTAYTDVETFKKCCGSLAYMSLFVCPAYELKDKSIYSVEFICRNVPGFFKYDMHTLLTSLGAIACDAVTPSTLDEIMQLPTLFECLQWLQVTPSIWTKIFISQYLIAVGKSECVKKVYAVSTFAEAVKLYDEVK